MLCTFLPCISYFQLPRCDSHYSCAAQCDTNLQTSASISRLSHSQFPLLFPYSVRSRNACPAQKAPIFCIERYHYPRNVFPVCGPRVCPNPIKFYLSVISCSCRAGVPLPVRQYSHRRTYVRNTAFADIKKSCKKVILYILV